MTLASVGFDHTNTPLGLLERVALSASGTADLLELLYASEQITEVVVLSTCMRTEIYFDALRFHPAVNDVLDGLAKVTGDSRTDLELRMLERYDQQVSSHLFRVAAGLESAVLGEHEILGQVARAWELARTAKSCRTTMNELFRHAVAAGKKARSETAISRGTTSIGQAAVAMAETQLGALADRRVLVLGAGEMGEAMGVALSYGKQAGNVVVCNRTFERAEALAERIEARPAPYESFKDELAEADVLLTSTGAGHVTLDLAAMERLMEQRRSKPMVIIDMGLPRDVDPRVTDVDGITLLDLENLRLFTEAGRNDRAGEIAAVEAIVEAEVSEYLRDVNIRTIAPLIQSLYARADGVRQAELARQQGRLSDFTEDQLKVVDGLTSSIVAKLLHAPVVRMKSTVGTPEGEYLAEAMRLLLGK